MKKIALMFICAIYLIIPCMLMFVGCQNSNSTFVFYYPDGSIYEEIVVKAGTKPSEVRYSNDVYVSGYEFMGWYSFYNGSFKNHSQFDISHDNYTIGTNSKYEYFALMKIKEDGWIYSGDNANAFVWDSGLYASPAIKLHSGDNYIKFDKKINSEALKYCSVFVNGGNGNYIESLEIFDNNGFKLSDIDLTNEVWENRDQQANDISSFILKIKATVDFEAGIMIGSDISW